jgi:hypothetical protein
MIGKIATAWAGTSGGPGITQLYIQDVGADIISGAQAQAAVNAVRVFWDALKTYMPDEVGLTVQPTIDMYDHGHGALMNTVTAATAPLTVQGTSTAVYSMAAGLKVNLQTASINNGRRVRGGIYVVPAASSAMTNAGVVAGATRTAINAAGATMMSTFASSGFDLIVWGRPVKDSGGTVTRQGTVNLVTAIETNEKSCILRGRRD